MEMSSYLYLSPDQDDLLKTNRQVTHDLLRDHLPFMNVLNALVSAHRPGICWDDLPRNLPITSSPPLLDRLPV
jgi:hypothetical protein